MKTLSRLIIAVLFITACNQKDNSVAPPVCESCNVSIDSGDLKMYIPLSLIDTSFSMVYDTHYDEVFLIDSFYNKERTIFITVKRDANVHIGNMNNDDILIPLSRSVYRVIDTHKGGAEILRADTANFNKYTKGGVVSYMYYEGWNGMVILVLHPDHGKWYNIDIKYNLMVTPHATDSLYKILGSITTRK